jgi:hypothetical protein
VPELEVWERPPSKLRNVDGGPPGDAGAGGMRAPTMLRNVDGGPPGVAGAGDLEAPTINAKKRRRRALGKHQSWARVRGHAVLTEPAPRTGR